MNILWINSGCVGGCTFECFSSTSESNTKSMSMNCMWNLDSITVCLARNSDVVQTYFPTVKKQICGAHNSVLTFKEAI